MGIGKWIGGLLGFFAMGPLGALAGIVLGSMYDDSQADEPRAESYADPRGGERNGFLFSLLVMASYIIRADGKIMPKGQRAALGYMNERLVLFCFTHLRSPFR